MASAPIRPFVPIALYEGALDALPAGLVVYRLDELDDPGSLRLLYANDAASRFIGLDLQALLGQAIRAAFPSLMETEQPAAFAEVARTGKSRDLGDVRYGDEKIREGTYHIRAFALPDQSVGLLFEDVTAGRAAEVEQAAERQFLGAVLENISEGVVACDADGRLTLFNRATREFHGLPEEPLPPDAWAEHYDLQRIDGSPLPTDEVPLVRAWKGEAVRDAPMRIVPKDGRPVRTLLASGRPITGPDGAPLGAVVAMHDVTEDLRTQREIERLTEAERATAREEARYRSLVEATAAIVWQTPPSGAFEQDQPAWRAFTGQSDEALRGAGWLDAVHLDDRARVVEGWERARAERAGYEVGLRLRRHDGVYRQMVARAQPILDNGGAVVEWVGAYTDVTERRRAEDALAEANRLLEARVAERTDELHRAYQRLDGIISGTTDLIAAIGPDLRVTAFNEAFGAAFQALYGRPLRVGMSVEEALPAEEQERARALAHWTRALGGEAFTVMQEEDFPGLGRRSFETIYSPIRDEAGGAAGAVSVVRDVTERAQARRQAEAFADSLRRLHAVVTAEHGSADELLHDYLLAGTELFRMPLGIISETPFDPALGERVYRLRAVVSPVPEIVPGLTIPLREAFCDAVVEREETVTYGDAAEVEALSCHPAFAERGLRAFIGAPIYVDDELFGTINFVSPEPRDGQDGRTDGFAAHEVELVELMAAFVGRQLALEAARRAGAEADARYRTVVTAMEVGVVLQDADAKILTWNDAAERALGLTADQLAGRTGFGPAWRAVHADGSAFPAEEHPAPVALRTGRPQHHVIMGVYRPDGQLGWFSVNAVPLFDPADPAAVGAAGGDGQADAGPADSGAADGDGPARPYGVVCSFTDVTELKRAEAALRSHTRELEDRNEELGQFAYVASHDLQEPLRMVTSFLQLLQRRYAGQLDDTAGQYIGFAVDGARRMQQLIQDLLAYSRVGTRGEPLEPVDTQAVVEEVVRDLGPMIAEAGATVEAAGLPTLPADHTQLHQLFLNLVANALKFRHPDRAPAVRISAAKGRERGRAVWRFQVEDNGIGLDEKYADRVFQIFQRLHTRGEYEGTGIGLAISKKIVERHDGSIGYTSEPGNGATFVFSLPAHPEHAA